PASPVNDMIDSSRRISGTDRRVGCAGRRVRSTGWRVAHGAWRQLRASAYGRHTRQQKEETDNSHKRNSGRFEQNVRYRLTPVMVKNPSPPKRAPSFDPASAKACASK